MQHQRNVENVCGDAALEELLLDLLGEQAHDEPDLRAATFEAAGMRTCNRGVVVSMPGGAEFQLTIVQSKHPRIDDE